MGPAPRLDAADARAVRGSRLAELVASLRGRDAPSRRVLLPAAGRGPQAATSTTLPAPGRPFPHAEAHPRDHASMRARLEVRRRRERARDDVDSTPRRAREAARRTATRRTRRAASERAVDLEDFDIVKPQKGRKW